ncbi:MAG: AI-2E family transporter, partial [Clostridia bacterium]|nr:AI-2E family transporter [Clostridia bacterium]
VTALVDAVPVFGTGAILIPMAIFNFLAEKTSLAWGILILYGTALLARQLCEPKIVGKKLGIHPLATIFSIYVGMKLFGVLGLVLAPITTVFLKLLFFSPRKTL